ncbi:MAG: hypothetical protein RL754_1362 [Bacteroidota bacterium]|jgi:predicted Zn-dependent peptidase
MKKYIYTLLIALGALNLSAQVEIDRTTAPTPGPAASPVIGAYESFELKNGLKVFVVEDHKLPRITMSLILDRDPIVEGEKAGYVSIAGDLIGAGTTSKTKAQLDEEVDFMGANFGTSATSVRVGGLSKYTDELIAILSDVVLNPAFPAEEFDKLKSQMLSGLKANADDVDAMSTNLRGAALFGTDHVYGEVMTEATVESVSIEDCKQYFNTYFRPDIAYMVVIGDITVKDAKKKLNKALKGWESAEVPSHEYAKTALPSAQRVVMIDKPSAVQSVVWLGNVIDLPHGHPDIEALRVANQILGGGMSGRLFSNLREDKAFTYGAYSNFSVDELNGTFSASAKVRNEVTDSAITEFLYEINRMRSELVSEEDMIAAKASLSGSFGRSLESPASAANFALNIARYNLPSDYYNNYLKRLEAVTAEDVKRVANLYMRSDRMIIAVVGKAQDVAAGLSAFGEIEYFDAEGKETDAPTFLFMPEGVSKADVLNKYFDAIGGVKALQSIEAIDQKMELEVPGMPGKIGIRSAKKAPGMLLMEQSMQGMTVMKQLLKDGEGKMSGMQGNKDLEGAELEALVAKAENIIDELRWLNEDAELVFEGQTLVGAKALYQMSEEVDGSKATHYFDVESGLLYQSVASEEGPEGPMVVTTTYEDYAEYNGVKFPKTTVQSVAGQQFTITLVSVEVNDAVKTSIFK